jgi:hypothetical protein
MVASANLTSEVGLPCHLLWGQMLFDQSTEARRIAINLDGHELWITSSLDWEGVSFLTGNPVGDNYPDCFELNVLTVDGRAIPGRWLRIMPS